MKMVKPSGSKAMLSANTHSPEFTLFAAVLAGGLSTRMGIDKRFLKFNGEYLIDRALRLGTEIVDENINHVFLCGEVPGRSCIPDDTPRIGPLGGLLTAFNRLKVITQGTQTHTWVAVFPVDMPLLNSFLFEMLASEISLSQNIEFSAVALQEYEMPFLVQYTDRTHCVLEEICNDRNMSSRSIHAFLEQIGVLKVQTQMSFQSCLLNANSTNDWAEICSNKRKLHHESQI